MKALFETKSLDFGGFIHYGDIFFPAGKITFITGESGCGKSTLLRLMNGIVSPSQGTLFYRGQDVSDLDTIGLRREVSLVSQEIFLFEGSIRDNFNAFCSFRHTSVLTDEEIKTFLSMMHLDFAPYSQTNTLSGGEKQRLYLAVFLSFRPAVLLLDEPTSALDARTGEAVLSNTILFCRENLMELLVVSHNRELADKFSENTLNLKRQAVV